jgi:hypothetical protein
MEETMKAIFKRLREPSTMAGLAALALVFGMPQELIAEAGKAVSGVLGLAAILMPERSGK